jgi:hypothetical protein
VPAIAAVRHRLVEARARVGRGVRRLAARPTRPVTWPGRRVELLGGLPEQPRRFVARRGQVVGAAHAPPPTSRRAVVIGVSSLRSRGSRTGRGRRQRCPAQAVPVGLHGSREERAPSALAERAGLKLRAVRAVTARVLRGGAVLERLAQLLGLCVHRGVAARTATSTAATTAAAATATAAFGGTTGSEGEGSERDEAAQDLERYTTTDRFRGVRHAGEYRVRPSNGQRGAYEVVRRRVNST